MTARTLSLALLTVLAGCGPTAPEPQAAAPVSALRGAAEFADCQWGEVEGEKLAIQAFACGPEQSHSKLVADNRLPGFWLEMTGDSGPIHRLAVRTFAKDAKAPLSSILTAVRIASPGPMTAACVLSPAPPADGQPEGRYVLEPGPRDKARWEASVMSDEPMEAPCGELGESIAGDRYFRALNPTTVAFVELGSEIQIYDPATLRVIP